MPAMNGPIEQPLEVDLLFAAMDADPGEEADIIFEWDKMEPVQQKAFMVTLRFLEEVLGPLEPKTWRGIGKYRRKNADKRGV